MFSSTKTLPMDVIRIDGGTQSRLRISTTVVDDYAEKIAGGEEFPPGVAFFDGKEYWLADGFHRYHALRKAKKVSMVCNVANGTVRDAILYSFGANGTHGLPMSNEDKRHVVTEMLNDFEWGEWSDREIARRCHVSNTFVSKIRAALNPVKKDAPRKQIDQHGNVTKATPIKQTEVVEPVPDEKDIEIARLSEHIDTLISEVDSLTLQLAVGSSDDPDFTKNMIEELRAEVKQLQIENASLVISRDQFQAENAQLIKQVNFLTKKLKQVSPA